MDFIVDGLATDRIVRILGVMRRTHASAGRLRLLAASAVGAWRGCWNG